MASILTITANPLLDHLGTGTVVAGQVNRVARLQPIAGGKGLNVARVLARHGHQVFAGGFIGGSTGDQLTRLVLADGIIPSFTPISAATRVGFLINQPDGTTTSVMERGPTLTSEEIGALVDHVRARLAEVDLVIISGGIPDDSAVDLYRLLLTCCAQANRPCWVDSYGPVMDRALSGPHPPALAKPNAQEYGDESGSTATSRRRWVSARELHRTDGAQSGSALTPWGSFHIVPPKITEKNPIGSGDCYLAALAHARLSNWSITDQLRYATAAGAANAARDDVANLTPEMIRDVMPLVEVRPS